MLRNEILFFIKSLIFLLYFRPDVLFLETIAHFPLVYWMKGKLTW